MSARPESGDEVLRRIAETFAELTSQLRAVEDPGSAFDAVTRVAVQRVPGTQAASVTIYQDDEFVTVSATHDSARRADGLQYELRSGPCVDAIIGDTVYSPADLSKDDRWPEYGRRVSEELGMVSMLSYRLPVDKVIGGLNLYSTRPHAFNAEALEVGRLLATHAAIALASQLYKGRANNLERALQTNRDIGTAVGVLMAQRKITRDQAFELIRKTSQDTNRKINDLAFEIAETGALPAPRGRSHR